MRMLIPGLRERRTVDRQLTTFFREHRLLDFYRAVRAISRYYDLSPPTVEWFEYIDWGKTAGRCFENGKILLVHPENWKRGRKYNSERQWINTVYHELGHFVLWSDAERKADTFAYRFVRGISAGGSGRGGTRLVASAARRKAALRRSRLRLRPRLSRSR